MAEFGASIGPVFDESAGISAAEQRKCWFALYVRSRHEKAVSRILRSRGHEEFLPLYRVQHRWADRIKAVELPMFTDYVFSRFRIELRHHVLAVPGVIGIVGSGKTPVPIEDSVIAALQRIAASGEHVREFGLLRVGQRVRVLKGALAGVEGILVEAKKTSRLIVSVDLLQRSVSVDIDAANVAPCEVTSYKAVSGT